MMTTDERTKILHMIYSITKPQITSLYKCLHFDDKEAVVNLRQRLNISLSQRITG